ncbi:hypothetical protein [Paenibacillus sp. GCM10027626]|uniref:hypothetical protein n=1 Tax=Paenibacillus sp. GCM10027626 TaxID=3273411 RepID=UPI00363EE2BF
MTGLSLPPGPKGLPFFGNMFGLGRDLLGYMTKCANVYGEVFRIEKDRDTIMTGCQL